MHRAGMLENKQNVFDDSPRLAEWLIENGYTKPRSWLLRVDRTRLAVARP